MNQTMKVLHCQKICRQTKGNKSKDWSFKPYNDSLCTCQQNIEDAHSEISGFNTKFTFHSLVITWIFIVPLKISAYEYMGACANLQETNLVHSGKAGRYSHCCVFPSCVMQHSRQLLTFQAGMWEVQEFQ